MQYNKICAQVFILFSFLPNKALNIALQSSKKSAQINSMPLTEKVMICSTTVTTDFIFIILPIITTENYGCLQSDVHLDHIWLLVFHHG